MASNEPGRGHGIEIVVAFVVVVFLAFLFLGDRFGAVDNGNHSNASAKAPPTASSPSTTFFGDTTANSTRPSRTFVMMVLRKEHGRKSLEHRNAL